jgi:hypothetical protein
MDGPIVDFEDYFGERGSSAIDMLEEIRCSCCERPFIACPCTPVEEGDCRAIRRLAGDGHIPESDGSH